MGGSLFVKSEQLTAKIGLEGYDVLIANAQDGCAEREPVLGLAQVGRSLEYKARGIRRPPDKDKITGVTDLQTGGYDSDDSSLALRASRSVAHNYRIKTRSGWLNVGKAKDGVGCVGQV